MSLQQTAAMIEAQDCRVVVRRVVGPEATELFFQCQPTAAGASAERQAEAAYRAMFAVLEGEGGSPASIVCETLFFQNLRADLPSVRAARRRVVAAAGGSAHRAAITEIEQPPLDPRVRLELAAQAIVAHGPAPAVDVFEPEHVCPCAECARSHGLRVRLGDEARLYAGGLCGPGEDAEEQARATFEGAERLLRRAGMDFRDVVRTWIHLRDIDRDYAALNRARRAFFAARGIDPAPASTGIGGAPAGEAHGLSLGLYALKTSQPRSRSPMSASTLNEAPEYGADFVRGMRLVETNKVALHSPGPRASAGGPNGACRGLRLARRSACFRRAALLEAQGAGFSDVVSAVTYLKRPADAERLRRSSAIVDTRDSRTCWSRLDLSPRTAVRNRGAGDSARSRGVALG
ncbi:MAG: RidA family protein [Myxococcota bacterium]